MSLAQAGWQVTVLERATELGEVGAGLATTRNGMTALAALGLEEAVREAGYETVPAGFQDPGGHWLMRIPDRPDVRAVTTIWGLQRQRLHQVLRHAAGASGLVELVTGAEVLTVQPGTPGSEPAAVTWRAGTTSDGRLTEAWGPGCEFGALRVSGTEMYWYGYFRNPEGAVFADELTAARERFATWAPWIRDLVAATPADRLMRHDVYHLPRGLPCYVRGRVVFAGDAAHAALPTAGQGAATALEDGVCVGRMIAAPARAGADLAAALTAYDQARRPRCRQIARTAAMTAWIGVNVGGSWRQVTRNTLLRLTPAGPLLKAGAPIVNWAAP